MRFVLFSIVFLSLATTSHSSQLLVVPPGASFTLRFDALAESYIHEQTSSEVKKTFTASAWSAEQGDLQATSTSLLYKAPRAGKVWDTIRYENPRTRKSFQILLLISPAEQQSPWISAPKPAPTVAPVEGLKINLRFGTRSTKIFEATPKRIPRFGGSNLPVDRFRANGQRTAPVEGDRYMRTDPALWREEGWISSRTPLFRDDAMVPSHNGKPVAGARPVASMVFFDQWRYKDVWEWRNGRWVFLHTLVCEREVATTRLLTDEVGPGRLTEQIVRPETCRILF